jgi:hydrogenase maturation protease
MRLAVIGVGQALRGDDGAGPEAVRLWRRSYATTAHIAAVQIHVLEQVGPELLELLADLDAAIVVDAVRSSSPAGTIHNLTLDQLHGFRRDLRAAHGWGIPETLRLGQAIMPDQLPRRLCLLGIELENTRLGTGLSAVVARALPAACEALDRQVGALLAS